MRAFGLAISLLATLTVPARADEHWVGTWATAAQRWTPGRLLNFRGQTVRLIVHTTAGGSKVRVRISNTYGDRPLNIGAVHIAHRATGADVDSASDRVVTFGGKASVTVAAHAIGISDGVELNVAPLSDLAISMYFPETTLATTIHALAKQTNYVSPESGDSTGAAKFTVDKTIAAWPFLTGVDVVAPSNAAAIVALGSSLTDGDGSTKDANKRWPDVLAERLQTCGASLSVLNEGIIGNRLLRDFNSPQQRGGPFDPVYQDLGPALGDSGLTRFDRDVLDQAGVKYVVLGLGVNDILFPGTFTPPKAVTAGEIIAGDRDLLRRGHAKGLRVIITTIPPFEGSLFQSPRMTFYTDANERVRTEVNAWIRSTKEFDGMIDFDEPVRDPSAPTRLRPDFDSGDHLHPNDAGYVATGNAIPLALFGCAE